MDIERFCIQSQKKISSDKTGYMHNQNKMNIENPCLAFYPLTGGSSGDFMGIKHQLKEIFDLQGNGL